MITPFHQHTSIQRYLSLEIKPHMPKFKNRSEAPAEESMPATVAPLPASTWAFEPLSSVRQAPWPTGQYDPFASRPSLRRSPTGSDVPQNQVPFDTRSFGRRPLVTHDDLPPPVSSYPSDHGIMAPDLATYAQRDLSFRSGPEDSSVGGRRQSQGNYSLYSESRGYPEYESETGSRQATESVRSDSQYHTRRRPYSQDEFDGPSQQLPLPVPQQELSRSQALPPQPIHLNIEEQDEIIRRANGILAQCAFHFIAKYQFPVPIERDKPRVRSSSDREWTEWAHLLKRLATKRRIPARVLFENQIKQLVTTLENSITVRYDAVSRGDQPPLPRSPRDDRYILQVISAGIQVARILVDSLAMSQLDELYSRTESVIMERRSLVRF